MKEAQQAIAVILSSPPQIVAIRKGALAFDGHGEHFEEVGLGPHNGFYDFLRSKAGEIIGFRYLPSPDADKVLSKVVEGPRLRFAPDGALRVLLIFLRENVEFDPNISSDQYFGDNAVYRAKNSGRLAIGFGIDTLSLIEAASLFARADLEHGAP